MISLVLRRKSSSSSSSLSSVAAAFAELWGLEEVGDDDGKTLRRQWKLSLRTASRCCAVAMFSSSLLMGI